MGRNVVDLEILLAFGASYPLFRSVVQPFLRRSTDIYVEQSMNSIELVIEFYNFSVLLLANFSHRSSPNSGCVADPRTYFGISLSPRT